MLFPRPLVASLRLWNRVFLANFTGRIVSSNPYKKIRYHEKIIVGCRIGRIVFVCFIQLYG